MHHIREGKHGTRSAKQAIAIGLSKARRAGVDLPPPEKGKTSPRTRKQAKRDLERGQSESPRRKTSPSRSRAIKNVLKGEGHEAASPNALSKQRTRRPGTAQPKTGRRRQKRWPAPKARKVALARPKKPPERGWPSEAKPRQRQRAATGNSTRTS